MNKLDKPDFLQPDKGNEIFISPGMILKMHHNLMQIEYDKEYFRKRFEKVFEKWEYYLGTSLDMYKEAELLEDLLKCFDEETE